MGMYTMTILTVFLFLGADSPQEVPRTQDKTVGEKLREAFPGSGVENASIRWDIRSKHLLVTADKFLIEADGRVRVEDCAIARFQPPMGSAKALQPTTIRCQYAIITLDRPAICYTDMACRKIVSIELSGGVRLAFEE